MSERALILVGPTTRMNRINLYLLWHAKQALPSRGVLQNSCKLSHCSCAVLLP